MVKDEAYDVWHGVVCWLQTQTGRKPGKVGYKLVASVYRGTLTYHLTHDIVQ